MKRLLALTAFAALLPLFQNAAADEKNPVIAVATAAATTGTKITNIDPATASKLLKSEKPPVVLDIRTPREFSNGHIAGAINIDFTKADFQAQIAKLDREQPYLLHCWSGSRSAYSLPVFRKLGFKKIYHLNRGLLDWDIARLPLE